jgi:hypothetical protein
MDTKLTPDELQWLRQLDTDALEKPDLPAPIADQLVAYGLAIRLVEGGLQLTAFGREHLLQAKLGEKK